MSVDLTNIEKIIHDFDGVYWDYYSLPGNVIYEICVEEDAFAAMEIIPGLDYSRATELARASFVNHHDCFGCFIEAAEQGGVSRDELIGRLFPLYHKNLYNRVKSEYPQTLKPSQDILNAFNRLNGRASHVLLSNASRGQWLEPCLEDLKMKKYFSRIIDYQDMGFISKSLGPDGVALALGDTHPSRAIFIEDGASNLQTAKRAYPELITVLVSGKTAIRPEGVDIMVTNPLEILDMLVGRLAPAAVRTYAMEHGL